MEMLGRSSEYINSIAHQGVQLNFNSALCGLVTPPRHLVIPANRRMSMPSDSRFKFKTPPAKSPDNQGKSVPRGFVTRNSPSRLSPSQLNVSGFYAGAKFGDRPLPTELPKPPVHWVNENKLWGSKEQSCVEMTNNLKVLLKVQS